jgi:hypothetical protein
MGKQVKKQIEEKKRLVGDITKPHLRQFFEIKTIGPEPPLNKEGFWPKPKHGIPVKVGSKKVSK